jgi:hypothetical protein
MILINFQEKKTFKKQYLLIYQTHLNYGFVTMFMPYGWLFIDIEHSFHFLGADRGRTAQSSLTSNFASKL